MSRSDSPPAASSCGKELCEEVPLKFAEELDRLLRHYTRQKRGNSYRPHNDNTNSGVTSHALDTPSGQGVQCRDMHNQQVGQDPLTPPSERGGVVHLGVWKGADLRLAIFEVQGYKDNQFYKELRERYTILRGFWRTWFSLWQYSDSDFVKFEKFASRGIALLGEDHPDPDPKSEYDYAPKPLQFKPLISKHEFNWAFYACHDLCPINSFMRLFHACKKINHHSRRALDHIPKKQHWDIEEDGDEEEIFWGIQAVEKPRLVTGAVYLLAVLIPTIIFSFLWLFSWGHSGDLQNAFVPIMVVAPFLQLFMRWSHKKNGDQGVKVG
ncbi:MAG: hypothetical protein M1834_001084 [Cirrosporium novae-zelandiae]|nr:MAG: hypothetical protein M1834_001084 [Cirrosporium novae-zelandiae]